MNFRDTIGLIKKALTNLYPETEIDAIIRIILSHKFGMSHYEQVSRANDIIAMNSLHQIYDIIQQLKDFIPIQYILGETEFYGVKFKVDKHVLIPRPETEELVDWIIKDAKIFEHPKILDIGTGSGCIAITLSKFIDKSYVTAIDVSEKALLIAQDNARRNKTNIKFIEEDILNYKSTGLQKFDIIVSNPPYVTPAQRIKMSRNVTDYEPELALYVPGKDPLLFYRVITEFACKHLAENGYLYFEINEILGSEIVKLVSEYGFVIELKKDLNQKDRMIKAWKNE